MTYFYQETDEKILSLPRTRFQQNTESIFSGRQNCWQTFSKTKQKTFLSV